jgi:hypothetical protein
MASSYIVEIADPEEFFNQGQMKAEKNENELDNFIKNSRNNPKWFAENCSVFARDGFYISPRDCALVGRKTCEKIGTDACDMIVMGNMKNNGKKNNWNVGGLTGAVWFDMNAKKYNVDYIRGVLLSKTTYSKEWTSDKPYQIIITIEKSN